MTQLTNDYIVEVLGNQGFSQGEDIFIPTGAPTTQTAALPIKSQFHRIIANKTASAALSMKSILSLDNPQVVILVNDDPTNAVVIFPFKPVAAGATDTAETINGVATGFTLAALTSAVFFTSLVQTKRKGSGTTNPLNWSGNTFS